MSESDLFTQAAAAREMGVTRAAVAQRLARNQFRKGDTDEVAGSTFITRRALTRWKAERAEKARKLATK